MKKVAVINQKGGVGKTTTTVNLGAALAERGHRVLLVDLDPQANLGTHLGLDTNEVEPTIYDVLVDGRPLAEVIHPIGDRLDCIPSNLDLSAAEMELVSMMGRETLLRDALEVFEKDESQHYDIVLFDCPPSLGVLSINALAAADSVVVPMQAEFFALQGMAKLTEIIDLVQRRINPRLALEHIVICKVDRRTRLTLEVLEEVRRHFGDALMRTMIRPNVKLAEAPSYGQSVLAYAPDSNGAADYRVLTAEWLGEEVHPVADAHLDLDRAAAEAAGELEEEVDEEEVEWEWVEVEEDEDVADGADATSDSASDPAAEAVPAVPEPAAPNPPSASESPDAAAPGATPSIAAARPVPNPALASSMPFEVWSWATACQPAPSVTRVGTLRPARLAATPASSHDRAANPVPSHDRAANPASSHDRAANPALGAAMPFERWSWATENLPAPCRLPVERAVRRAVKSPALASSMPFEMWSWVTACQPAPPRMVSVARSSALGAAEAASEPESTGSRGGEAVLGDHSERLDTGQSEQGGRPAAPPEVVVAALSRVGPAWSGGRTVAGAPRTTDLVDGGGTATDPMAPVRDHLKAQGGLFAREPEARPAGGGETAPAGGATARDLRASDVAEPESVASAPREEAGPAPRVAEAVQMAEAESSVRPRRDVWRWSSVQGRWIPPEEA